MKRVLIALLLVLTTGQMMAQIRLPERPNRPRYVDHSETTSGFWCAVEANVGSSILFKDGVDDAQRAGLSFIGGYMVNEYLKIGLGLGGYNYYKNNEQLRSTSIEWTMPIYLDLRGNMTSQESRNFLPYWSVDIGGAVRDGFFFSPTVGMKFGEIRDSWLIGISYNLQQIKNWTVLDVNAHRTPHGKTTPETVSFVSIKVGYEF